MSDHKALTLALLLPLGLAVTSPALAQDGPHGPQMMFEELDLNGDGQITPEELTDRGPARFAEADADGDGVLTRAEMLAQAQDRTETRIDQMLARLDTDGDGAISEAEMTAMMEAREARRHERIAARMVERFDADGDGAISRAEFEAAAEGMQGRHGGSRGHGWFGHRG